MGGSHIDEEIWLGILPIVDSSDEGEMKDYLQDKVCSRGEEEQCGVTVWCLSLFNCTIYPLERQLIALRIMSIVLTAELVIVERDDVKLA